MYKKEETGLTLVQTLSASNFKLLTVSNQNRKVWEAWKVKQGKYVYFSPPTFLSPRPSIPASKFPILALNFNYKQSKTKCVGGMDPRPSMYVCLFLSPPFLSK